MKKLLGVVFLLVSLAVFVACVGGVVGLWMTRYRG